MSHGISSPSQENRSPDHPLPLVSAKVVNKQEMAFTSDTALKDLKASQNEVEFLNDELFRTSEQAEVDFRRLEHLRNVYETALEAQADTIFRLRNDLSSLQEDSQKQKASQDKISKELDKLKDRNNTQEAKETEVPKLDTVQLWLEQLAAKRLKSLEDEAASNFGKSKSRHPSSEIASQQKPVNPWVAQAKSLEDEAASNAGKSKRRHSSSETAFQQEPVHPWLAQKIAEERESLEDEATSNVGKRKPRHSSPETAFQQELSKRRKMTEERESLEDEATSNVGKRKPRHSSPETAFQQELSKRRKMATVAEAKAAAQRVTVFWKPPPRVTGFWKPSPEDDEQS